MKVARALVVLLAALAFGALLYAFAGRAVYPFDLEWMEGGMLVHSLRLLEGKPLYGPPALDFVPFLYTPLYPAVLAALAKLLGLGYSLARALSIVSYLGASAAGLWLVRRLGGSWLVGLAALAIPAAAFVPTGAWYDLARPDSLALALTTLGVLLGWRASEGSHLAAVLAAASMVTAFFAKQTSSAFMLAVAGALLARHWRVGLTYLVGLALLGLPPLLLLDHASQGWFWTFVFRLHQQHPFRPVRGFLAAPGLLALLLAPGLALCAWAIRRARSAGLLYACWVALWGWLVSCLGYGTQWAFVNAIVPGVFFSALAIGIAAGRLLQVGLAGHRPLVVLGLLGLGLLFAPNGPARLILPLAPPSWKMAPRALTGYDPRPFVPRDSHRQAGEALLARLRRADGDVLIPPHPFYAFLAGKPVHLHSMGLLDVVAAGLPPPRGLPQALREKRFALIVMDDTADLGLWPGLLQHYCLASRIDGPRMITGTPLAPALVLAPRPRGSGPPELQPCPP